MAQASNSNARQPLYSVPKQEIQGSPANAHEDCKSSLIGVIESQIIPRLLEAHPLNPAASRKSQQKSPSIDSSEVEGFADLCLNGGAEQAIAHVEALTNGRGVPRDDIFLGLIAPAARLMGTYWEEDVLDFTQVTLGLMRLQQITHHIGYEYQDGPQSAGAVRRVMLASAPGSQHILGLSMVSEFFRKDGWQVVVEVAPTQLELCHAAQNEWFDLIGISVGLVEQLDDLPALIDKIKKASRNPNTPVLLGGPAFLAAQADAASMGANAICTDPREGLKLASALVDPTKA